MQPKGDGECRSTIVLPAVFQDFAESVKISEFGACFTSAVRTVPFGNSVQPSSALKSLLPVPDITVQVRVFGFSIASVFSSLLPTRKFPLGRTSDGESPM